MESKTFNFKWDFGSPHTPFYSQPGIKAGYESCRNDYNPIEGKLHITTKPTIHFPYFLIECEFRAVEFPITQIDSEISIQVADEKALQENVKRKLNVIFLSTLQKILLTRRIVF